MGNKQYLASSWAHMGLGVLGFTVVLLILTWLMHKYWILQYVSFGDALFMMGILACATASAGIMRNPFGEMLGPWGVTAQPVQPTAEEKRLQQITDFVVQRAFGFRLLAAGLIIILISVMVVYIK